MCTTLCIQVHTNATDIGTFSAKWQIVLNFVGPLFIFVAFRQIFEYNSA